MNALTKWLLRLPKKSDIQISKNDISISHQTTAPTPAKQIQAL